MTHLVVDVHTGALTIDRLFSYVDLMSAGIVLLYTLSGVATGYLKSIELTFVNLLIQGTLETILNMGKCGGSNIKATELGRNFDQKAL